MFEAAIDRGLAKPALYAQLAASLGSLLEGETDTLANLANATGLLAGALERVNWCGFYLLRKGELVLGPFQGQPACVRIALGRGVCGTSQYSGTFGIVGSTTGGVLEYSRMVLLALSLIVSVSVPVARDAR